MKARLYRWHDNLLIGLAVVLIVMMGIIHAIHRVATWTGWVVLALGLSLLLIPALITILLIRIFLPESLSEQSGTEA